jgi:hypothetical protein
MSELTLRSVRPVEPKEITPIGVWLVTRFVLASVFVLMAAPFVMPYLGQ